MVLTKEELISALQHESRILVHLAGKVDRTTLDYRPTATQRSTLELLQYMSMMGPTLIEILHGGDFMQIWRPAEEAAKALSFDQAVAAIERQAEEYARLLNGWKDSEFREQIDLFGNKSTRGAMMVNLVLGGHAAYRTQLFGYLKACGRSELNTMNLWAGQDGPA